MSAKKRHFVEISGVKNLEGCGVWHTEPRTYIRVGHADREFATDTITLPRLYLVCLPFFFFCTQPVLVVENYEAGRSWSGWEAALERRGPPNNLNLSRG